MHKLTLSLENSLRERWREVESKREILSGRVPGLDIGQQALLHRERSEERLRVRERERERGQGLTPQWSNPCNSKHFLHHVHKTGRSEWPKTCGCFTRSKTLSCARPLLWSSAGGILTTDLSLKICSRLAIGQIDHWSLVDDTCSSHASIQLPIINVHSHSAIILSYEQYWCTSCWHTSANEGLVHKLMQLQFQFP